MTTANASLLPRKVLQPSRGWPSIKVRELWQYRTLIGTLTGRQIQVRYAQSVLGIGWSVIRPLMSMIVLTIVFDKFARLPSNGHPYPVFSLAAVVPWTYFSTALTGAGESLSGNASMITKVYFPRLALPIANVLAPLVDFAIGLALLLVLIAWFGLTPSFQSVIVVPLCVIAMMLTAIGIGALVAAVDVQFRDAARIVPFALQLWMYASPIVYPMSLVPKEYRGLYALNPMAGIIESFRSTLLGAGSTDWRTLILPLVVSAVICLTGITYFRHRERVFADVV